MSVRCFCAALLVSVGAWAQPAKKNKPVVLPDGRWLSAASTEGNADGWRVHFEVTADQGATWQKVGPVAKGPNFDAIQPSILFHRDGALQALCRTRQVVIAQTWSRDQGRTWSALTAIDLPNPNSGTDAVTLREGLGRKAPKQVCCGISSRKNAQFLGDLGIQILRPVDHAVAFEKLHRQTRDCQHRRVGHRHHEIGAWQKQRAGDQPRDHEHIARRAKENMAAGKRPADPQDSNPAPC